MYFVSRQHYWGVDDDAAYLVEISVGGSDLANADMLGVRWRKAGEGQEFEDPREAVEAACKILALWRAAGQENAQLGYGCTGGFTLPFDPCTVEEAERWAEERWEKLPKCGCGKILGKEKYYHDLSDGEEFCSNYCADKDYHFQISCNKEDEDDS